MLDLVAPIIEMPGARWVRAKVDVATNSVALDASVNGVDWVRLQTRGSTFAPSTEGRPSGE